MSHLRELVTKNTFSIVWCHRSKGGLKPLCENRTHWPAGTEDGLSSFPILFPGSEIFPCAALFRQHCDSHVHQWPGWLKVRWGLHLLGWHNGTADMQSRQSPYIHESVKHWPTTGLAIYRRHFCLFHWLCPYCREFSNQVTESFWWSQSRLWDLGFHGCAYWC